MKLKHIEVLNAIKLTGTVSGAARLLNVTQPAITQTLQHAELQIGFPLFNRVRNRLIATREALALYPEIERLYAQMEAVRNLAHNLRQGSAVEIRILIVPSLAVLLLPLALGYFRKKYAAVPINIRTLHSRDIVTAIALREADVGIVYGSMPHPSVVEIEVAQGHLVCVRRSAKKMSSQVPTSIHLQELQGQPLIRIYQKDPIGFLLNDLCTRFNLEFTGGITVQTHHTALSLAEHGFGPAIVDVFTAASCQNQNMQVIPLAPEVPVEITALRANTGDEITISNFFIDCVRKAANDMLRN